METDLQIFVSTLSKFADLSDELTRKQKVLELYRKKRPNLLKATALLIVNKLIIIYENVMCR
jgi:hypothetical protein